MNEKIEKHYCDDCMWYEHEYEDYYNVGGDYDTYEYARCRLYGRELDPCNFNELHSIADKCTKYAVELKKEER